MTSTCTNIGVTPVSRRRTPLLERISHGLSVHNTRRSLKGLNETRLEDIGISMAQAQTEARRPFWDVPEYWQR